MLNFQLVTPTRLQRDETVHMVVVPGSEGDFGAMEGHAPFLSTVRDGELAIYRTPGADPERLRVEGGLAEVSARGLTVLAERVTAST